MMTINTIKSLTLLWTGAESNSQIPKPDTKTHKLSHFYLITNNQYKFRRIRRNNSFDNIYFGNIFPDK